MKKINFLILALCSTLMIEGSCFAVKTVAKKEAQSAKNTKEVKKLEREVVTRNRYDASLALTPEQRKSGEIAALKTAAAKAAAKQKGDSRSTDLSDRDTVLI
jgi:hypothetical protein